MARFAGTRLAHARLAGAKFTRIFGMSRLRVKLTRGLRFRLMISYLLFFSLLMVIVGLFFRQILKFQLQSDVRAALEEEWGAAKGYLRIENHRPIWIADLTDPEEGFIVSRLQHVYLVADSNGNVLDNDTSGIYQSIGFDSKEEIQRILAQPQPVVRIRYDKSGEPFLIKAGMIPDEHRRPYFFALGRSLGDAQRDVRLFTRNYFLFLPLLIAISSVLGWLVAGRAIEPLNSVAQAAQNMTGSNLNLQIPLRGAGDELDHLIDSFNRMTTRLGSSFEQIRRFSTDVSHELRTPLTAIRGQLEVALFTAETPEQYREAMANALEDVEQISSIVRALLLLSQAESGQLVLQKSALDLGGVALDIVDQFQIPAQEKEIQLEASISPKSMIVADRTQIERLLSNLLSNALKYTPKGGSVHVRVSPDQSPLFMALEVEDTGAGIAAENLPHIFDRFYRVRNPETNQIHGLGLGLSFVSWIVEAHGGRIDVSSTVGEGTRFRILLPRDAEAEHPAESGAKALAG
ncbi:MAG TPA: ATP-binding protein [Bryobacteraceae bacterium]|nr:ATP-binding protein [Bryobacteraceae bacterium]